MKGGPTFALDAAAVDELVARLGAERERPDQLELPSVSHPKLTLDDAYGVQRAVSRRLQVEGISVIGRKVGLVDPGAQARHGVQEPIAGRLYDHGLLPEGGRVDAVLRGHGRIECELAFLLGEDLSGPGVTGAHVLAATAGVAPAFELIEDRLPTAATVADMVADNCSGAGVMVGSALVAPSALDLTATGVVLEVDGQVVATGASGAVMGNPTGAVAWLANRLAALGERLHAGEIVLTGAVVPPLPVDHGRAITARFGGGLGPLSAVGTG